MFCLQYIRGNHILNNIIHTYNVVICYVAYDQWIKPHLFVSFLFITVNVQTINSHLFFLRRMCEVKMFYSFKSALAWWAAYEWWSLDLENSLSLPVPISWTACIAVHKAIWIETEWIWVPVYSKASTQWLCICIF